MATIVDLPADPRIGALEQGLATGTQNYFSEQQKVKLQRKFQSAFKAIDASTTYEDAIRNIADLDPEIMTNPDAMTILSSHIDKKFPEQEAVEVVDSAGKIKSINQRRGHPLTSDQLAAQGYTLASDAGVGHYVTLDEKNEDMISLGRMTEEQAQAKAGGRDVMRMEDVSAESSIRNAFANQRSARAQEITARQKGKDKEDKPTEFDQKVTATAQRLGLDVTNPEERNKAINVQSNRESTVKGYREYFTKTVGNEIFLTEDIARAHIANGETIIESALAETDGPETAKKLALADAYYNIANDPSLEKDDIKERAHQDFFRLTGVNASDQIVRSVVEQYGPKMQEGEQRQVPIKDKKGNTLSTLRLFKIGGHVLPVSQFKPEKPKKGK